MKASSVTIVALTALAPTFVVSACGSAETRESPLSSARLLSYHEEGGIGGPRPFVAIFEQGRATLWLGTCSTSFGLRPRLWQSLRAALKSADLGSIVGDYPAPSGSADLITQVIRSGGHEVSISAAPESEEALSQLNPLLEAIGKVIAAGERHLPSSCPSHRTGAGGVS